MPSLALTRFSGEIPRVGKEQLPDFAASIAANCLLLSGELRGIHAPVPQYTFVGGSIPTVTRTFSLEATDTYPATWIGFGEESTYFLKGPLVNDAYDRYYITSDIDNPRMTTRARLEADDPAFLLGTPRPTNVMTVTPDGTGIGLTVTRAYVYTLVSPYGEEGAVSEPVLATGKDDDQWDLANMDTTVPNPTERPSGYTKRIYRTVTGISGTAAYFFVDEIPLATATYADTEPTDEVSLNDTCESFLWGEPPTTLKGLVSHPSGFLVGYDGHDVWFSEAYRPHAWPPSYVLSTDHKVVGLGIFGNSIAVMTEGYPYIISGNHPSALALRKHNASEPCLNRKSIVEMPFGVYYASLNGLQLATATTVVNATQQLITRDEWDSQYDLTTLQAARYNDYYVGFYTPTDGFMFAPSEPTAMFSQLRDHWDIDAIQTDSETGKTIVIKDNIVSEWNAPTGEPQLYTWRSKKFVLPRPSNMAAFRVSSYTLEQGIDDTDARKAYNDARIVYPFEPLSSNVLSLCRVENIPGGGAYENKSPLGGPLLQDLNQNVYSLAMNVYSDDELVYTSSIDTTDPLRLPSGFKSTRLEIELVGNVPVTSVKLASTGKGLASV